MNQFPSTGEGRPDFIVYLGLLPPYSLEDVHKAYKARAREVHPDTGGSTAEFLKLQHVYTQAQEYVKFHEGRRQWLATQVEPYLQQQAVAADVERRGGSVDIERLGWMEQAFGDFALLAERLRGIRLRGCAEGDEFLKSLAESAKHLRYLRELDIADSTISDAGLRWLLELRGLERINLRGTSVTAAGLTALAELPQLEWVNLAGTPLGWWTRRQVRRALPGVELVARE